MKNRVYIFLIMIFLITGISTLYSIKNDEIILKAKQAYDSQEYQKAVDLYLQVERSQITNPDLYYNIGNCFYRLDKIGPAILYFKKALWLNSAYKPAKKNLDYLISKTKDAQITPKNDYISVVASYIYNMLSLNAIAVLSIVLFAMIIACVHLLIHKRREERHSYLFVLTILVIFWTLLFSLSILKYVNYLNNNEAVVLTSSSIGFSGPGESFTRVFTIHEGLIIQVVKNENDWAQISLPNGLSGWIRQNTFHYVSEK